MFTVQDLIESDDVPLWRLVVIAGYATALYFAFLLKTATKRDR